jgi:hypothetical protein
MKILPTLIEWHELDKDHLEEIPEEELLMFWADDYSEIQFGMFDRSNHEFFSFTHWARFPTPEESIDVLSVEDDSELSSAPERSTGDSRAHLLAELI